MLSRRLLGSLALALAITASAGLAQVPLRVFDGIDYGVSPNAWFGSAVAGVGDVDGDGHDDIAVGAPYELVGGVPAGRLRVLSGADGSLLFAADGVGPDSAFGAAVSPAGDIDMDGSPDVLVGAPWSDFTGTNSGSAWVLSGRDGGVLFVFSGLGLYDYYGTAVAAAGRVDGDAFPDIVIGATNTNEIGYAEVRSGRDGALLYRVHGTGARWEFGASVCGAGDLDGDGLDDVVVGEPQTPSCCGGAGPFGEVFAFLGPTGSTRRSVVIPARGGQFGASVSRIGDLTGDGRAEILIGAPLRGVSTAPKAFVWDVVHNALIRTHTVNNGYLDPIDFGTGSAGPGDMNGDGVPDYAVSSPEDGFNGFVSGSVFLYSGSDGSLLYRVLNLGDSDCDRFGTALAAAGDVDGDGRGDLAIGTPWDSPFGSCPWTGPHDAYGRVLVFSLAPPSARSYCTAKVNSLGCTPRMSWSGTPSPEGPDDFVVHAEDVISNKVGLLAWSLEGAAQPFGGGVLCVGAPIRRTPVQSSGGNPPPADCSGSLQFHFTHVFMWTQLLVPGTRVHAQFLYRDPGSPSGPLGLTDALEWIVGF